MPIEISVVLPCYNERANVLALIPAIHQSLQAYAHEIILVDDGSGDGTKEAVAALQDPLVQWMLRPNPRSLGGSILEGIHLARGNAVIVMDSDFNHDPRLLERFAEEIKHQDVVSASRFLPGGQGGNWWRSAASCLLNTWICFHTQIKCSDVLFGYWGVKRHVLKNIPLDAIFYGHGDYMMRWVYVLQRRGIKIKEIPGRHGRRLHGQGNGHLGQMLIKYLQAAHQLKKLLP